MTKYEQLEMLMADSNGYLIVSKAVESGISKQYVNDFIKKNHLAKAAPGIYIAENVWLDTLYVISLRNNIVFSHETALYLHSMTEREPNRVSLTVAKDYNATHLRKCGFRVYTDTRGLLDEGRTIVDTIHGNPVPVYDVDRTICEIIKMKDQLDVQFFQYAMKEYMNGKKKDLHNLMYYAKLLNIEDKVRFYTEVML